MKVLLLEDVYKLGRAGDVKKVADGFGRNYLIPQGLAVLATPGALKQIEHIRSQATARRAILNEEMSSVAEHIKGLVLTFPVKAGETGKLYGSVTSQMIADAVQEKTGVSLERRQVDSQPIRSIGEHTVSIRLTMDLAPEISIIVHREGEAPESALTPPEEVPPEESEGEVSPEESEAEISLEETEAETTSETVQAE